MSDMNGNPYYEVLARFNNRDLNVPEISYMQAQATLALAYEQRTANLIAAMSVLHLDATGWHADTVTKWANIACEVEARLAFSKGATE